MISIQRRTVRCGRMSGHRRSSRKKKAAGHLQIRFVAVAGDEFRRPQSCGEQGEAQIRVVGDGLQKIQRAISGVKDGQLSDAQQKSLLAELTAAAGCRCQAQGFVQTLS